jgi:hypothetical protein
VAGEGTNETTGGGGGGGVHSPAKCGKPLSQLAGITEPAIRGSEECSINASSEVCGAALLVIKKTPTVADTTTNPKVRSTVRREKILIRIFGTYCIILDYLNKYGLLL